MNPHPIATADARSVLRHNPSPVVVAAAPAAVREDDGLDASLSRVDFATRFSAAVSGADVDACAPCLPCDTDDATAEESGDECTDGYGLRVARRWARDARRVCDWRSIPPQLDVAHTLGGAVPADRGARKRQQILNVVLFVTPFLIHNPKAVVVDFCCGGAHQTLPLAYRFPEARFILLDAKQKSLDVAEQRVAAAGLRNIRVVCGMIEDFHEPFDVGVALHACGGSSDVAMEKCVQARAAYVIAPCCVGKIALAAGAAGDRNTSKTSRVADAASLSDDSTTAAATASTPPATASRPERVTPGYPQTPDYPRSRAAAAVLSRGNYVAIAQAADFGHDGYDACGALAPPLRAGASNADVAESGDDVAESGAGVAEWGSDVAGLIVRTGMDAERKFGIGTSAGVGAEVGKSPWSSSSSIWSQAVEYVYVGGSAEDGRGHGDGDGSVDGSGEVGWNEDDATPTARTLPAIGEDEDESSTAAVALWSTLPPPSPPSPPTPPSPRQQSAALVAAKREKRHRLRNRAPKMSAGARAAREAQRRACKAVIESDRNASAAEQGYLTWQVLMVGRPLNPDP